MVGGVFHQEAPHGKFEIKAIAASHTQLNPSELILLAKTVTSNPSSI